MSNFSIDRKRKSDKYLPEQIKICSRIFQCKSSDFRLSTLDEDYNGIDLWYQDISIALRIRHRKLEDLTIRLSKDINGTSELEKIKMRNMDYILQCESDKLNPDKISKWDLFDVQELAPALDSDLITKQEFNLASDKHFICYSIDDLCEHFPKAFIARGLTLEKETMHDDGSVTLERKRVSAFSDPRDFYASKLR